jgi:hypothetical protein
MLANLTTPSPDTLKVQSEIRATNRAARSEELERLNALLDDYTNERKISSYLPEDVEVAKKFLKGRIATIQASPAMTEDAILTLNGNKESQNFEHLNDSIKIRAQFHKKYTELKGKYTKAIDELKSKKIPVPPSLPAGVSVSEEALKWLNKSTFETPDTYSDKESELRAKYEASSGGVQLGDIDSVVNETEVKTDKERNTFSIGRLFKDILARVGGNFAIFMIITGMILGSSLATNLNLYKNWAFRTLYAVYGALFFLVVIPYVLIYRWGINGRRPKFYSLIPLFPYHWNNRFAQITLGWMSYRPDDAILALREWEMENRSST